MVVVRRIPAPSDAVRAATAEPIAVGFADPVGPHTEGDAVAWTSVPDVVEDVRRTAEIRAEGPETVLALRARYSLRLPYFGRLFAPLVARSIRRSLEHMAAVIEARALGRPPPAAPRRPLWAPPDRAAPAQARAIATLCAALAITGYGGSLFTQTLDFIADTYHSSDADLGVALAVTRVGTLIGLAGSVLADRRGRRAILLVSTAGVCLASLLSAFAPSLPSFAALQVFVRGFVNLSAVVGYIAVTEEASEGARAYTLALAGIAGGAGFAVGAGLLPLADLGGEAWRALFALAGLGLLLVPGIARRLPETRRYAGMAARAARATARELTGPTYGRRFALVAATGFLMAFFASPAFQFTNRYLGDDRGYSGFDILVLRFVTQGAPALVAIWIGGRLAESAGRKPVAARATFVMALGTAGFYLAGGPGLWLALLASTVAGAIGGPSMSAFNTELFPTEVRGRAGAGLLGFAVAGSAAGLLLAGYLADPLGSIGPAVALTAVAPVVVALALIPRLPEARGRALDEVSPPEV